MYDLGLIYCIDFKVQNPPMNDPQVCVDQVSQVGPSSYWVHCLQL